MDLVKKLLKDLVETSSKESAVMSKDTAEKSSEEECPAVPQESEMSRDTAEKCYGEFAEKMPRDRVKKLSEEFEKMSTGLVKSSPEVPVEAPKRYPVEASTKNSPMDSSGNVAEHLLNDFSKASSEGSVEGSSEDQVEEVVKDLVEASSKASLQEQANLEEGSVEESSGDEVEEVMKDLVEASSKTSLKEQANLVEASSKASLQEQANLAEGSVEGSSEDQVEEVVKDLVEASSKASLREQANLAEKSSEVLPGKPFEDSVQKTSQVGVVKWSDDLHAGSFKHLMAGSSKDWTAGSSKDWTAGSSDDLMAGASKDFVHDLIKELGETTGLRTNTSKDLVPGPLNEPAGEFEGLEFCNSEPLEGACGMSAAVEKNVIYRRNDPGTKREDWCNWPDMPFEEMESTLNVQQYIQQCIHKDPSDVDTILKAPPGQEEGVWKYEHVRQFCMQLNGLTLLLQDECKPDVCVQMTATEQWIFLCAAHKNPKECSAIDYTRHTLDGAAALLNSNKYFPSRVSIKESSIAKIGSVCRRIYRIFSHAYFHHPELFQKFEAETHLCRRFTVFVKKYNLMANEHLIVPIPEQKPNHS